MSCAEYRNVVVCRPSFDGWERFFVRCPHCKTRRLCLGEFQDYYGWDCTCLTCGQQWMGSESRYYSKRDSPKDAARAKARIKEYIVAGIPQGLAAFFKRIEAERQATTSAEGGDNPN